MIGKNKLMALTLIALIFLSANFASAAVNSIISNVQIKPSSANATDVINCSATYNDWDLNKGNVTFSWYNGSMLYWQVTQFNKLNNEVVNEPLTWVNRNGLVGYWKFSEGNGTQTRDISGNENNGTLANFNFNANSGWVEGKLGKGLQFDGVNDYVDVGSSGSLDLTNELTVIAWVKFDNVADSVRVGNIIGNYPISPHFNFEGHTSGRIRFYWDGEVDFSGTKDLRGTWHHVAVVRNKVTNKITLYVDGIFEAESSAGTNKDIQWPLRIGKDFRGDPGIPFHGLIDEVRIYNRSLTSTEINASYQNSPHARGETWNCTINATDSIGNAGLPNSTTITISDSAPNITSITIAPSPAYDDSELNCSAIYGNPDGNKGNVTLSWYNGSNLYWQVTQFNKFAGEQINEPLTWVDKNGLVGYWKFSEGNGTIAYDISSNGLNINNGTLNNFNFNTNSGWVQGMYGSGLQFDGSNDYIDVGNAASLNITGAITIEAWVKPASGPVSYPNIVGHGNGMWAFGLSNEAGNVGKVFISKSGSPPFVTGTTVLSNNIWYHVVGTIASASGEAKIYVNGILENTGTAASFTSNAISVAIGRGGGGTGGIINGTIDEVRIYNRTLSSEEINASYAASPHAKAETWNCTINATDSQGMVGLPNSTVITIGSQSPSPQNYTPKWVRVTVTYNKATRQKKIYVNGNLTKTEMLSGLGDYKINNQAGNLYLGKLSGLPSGNPFNGSIDEISISPKEKSASEIMQDYINNIIYGDMPGPNEAKTFTITGENYTEISIAPIVKAGKNEKTCEVTSKVRIPPCN